MGCHMHRTTLILNMELASNRVGQSIEQVLECALDYLRVRTQQSIQQEPHEIDSGSSPIAQSMCFNAPSAGSSGIGSWIGMADKGLVGASERPCGEIERREISSSACDDLN